MNEQLIKRLKSFGWRTLCVAIVGGLGWASANLNLLEIPDWALVLIGLALSEVTKWFNNNTTLFGAKLK